MFSLHLRVLFFVKKIVIWPNEGICLLTVCFSLNKLKLAKISRFLKKLTGCVYL